MPNPLRLKGVADTPETFKKGIVQHIVDDTIVRSSPNLRHFAELARRVGISPSVKGWSVIGGIDFPIGPIDFVSHPVPTGVEVEWVGTDVDLGAMLERGEIDALISADAPKAILEGSPKVGRQFEDYEQHLGRPRTAVASYQESGG